MLVTDREVVPRFGVGRIDLGSLLPAIGGFFPEAVLGDLDPEFNLRLGFVANVDREDGAAKAMTATSKTSARSTSGGGTTIVTRPTCRNNMFCQAMALSESSNGRTTRLRWMKRFRVVFGCAFRNCAASFRNRVAGHDRGSPIMWTQGSGRMRASHCMRAGLFFPEACSDAGGSRWIF